MNDTSNKLMEVLNNTPEVKRFSQLGVKVKPYKRMIRGERSSVNNVINVPIVITDAILDITTGRDNNTPKMTFSYYLLNDSRRTIYKVITSARLLIQAIRTYRNSLNGKEFEPFSTVIKKVSQIDEYSTGEYNPNSLIFS